MGYATVLRVPRISTYAEALKKFDNTKPIKGREPEIRPLGDRRNVDTYSIRKNVWNESIELVLYRTPVIKFTLDDEVKISFGRWSSASTCQFISRVLLGVGAYRVKGQVVLGFTGTTTKAMIGDHEELVLVRGANGGWIPKEKQVLCDYRISRKEANNVRKMVSQFRDYLSGVLKLKTEEIVLNEGTYYEQRHNVVRLTYDEMVAVFGKDVNTHNDTFRPAVAEWVKLDEKPKWTNLENHARLWQAYRDRTTKFFDLVRNDQDDNARHQNYWIAFNILFAQGNNLYWRDSNNLYWRDNMDAWASLGVDQFEKSLDKILFTTFADRVFKRVELPEGRVPTGKYDDYVMTEEG